MRTISNIVVDIETIPGLDKPGPDDISVPANYKNPEVIEKYRTDPDRINELWIKQSLDFIRGRIHTIAWKINDEPTQSIWHDGTDEEGLLKRFEQALLDTFKEHYGNDTMYGVTWVGHNIKRFDAPFIWLRARKYKCEKLIKMLGESPRDVKMEDTMLWCNFNSYRDYVSLDAACKLFGLPGKGEMDGSQVFKYWQAGKNEEIGMYGAGDVGRTYNLARALGIIIPMDE
jgi:predicted PolB exonuclease-like 3'-5' exonuclease